MAFERVAEYMDFYYRFGERDARQDYLRGKSDGEREVPATDARVYSTHEQRFINEAKAARSAYQRAVQGVEESLEARIKRLEIEEFVDYKKI